MAKSKDCLHFSVNRFKAVQFFSRCREPVRTASARETAKKYRTGSTRGAQKKNRTGLNRFETVHQRTGSRRKTYVLQIARRDTYI